MNTRKAPKNATQQNPLKKYLKKSLKYRNQQLQKRVLDNPSKNVKGKHI